MGPGLAAVLGEARVGALGLDAGALGDAHEEVVLVLLADAARHGAVLGHGVAEAVADHGEFVAAGAVGVGGQVVVYLPEALGTVVVVRVDHGKGAVHDVPGREYGVAGAPGLHAPFGHGVALRQVGELLIGIAHVNDLAQTVADGGLEGVLELALYHEHDGLEAGAARVVYRVVYYELTVVPHGVELL